MNSKSISIIKTIIITFGLMLALVMMSIAQASTLSAQLDRNSVTLGESVSLSITLPQTANAQPDLKPLLKNFDILGTSSSSQVQIINGKRSERRELNISLMPQQQGDLEIPALKVGQDTTSSLKLTVTAAPTVDSTQSGNPVFIELVTPLDSHDVIVNQEIPLTVRLYTSLPLQGISLSKPSPANAIVEKLGEDKQFQAERNGQNYQVVEQHYAVFPEKPGDLIIPPVLLRAIVPDQQQASRGRSSLFDDPFIRDSLGANSGLERFFDDSFFNRGMSRGKPLTLGSAGMKFSVAHIPEMARGKSWLPASNITLTDSWNGNPPTFKSGEPVTFTVTVKAEGLSGEQIPALAFPVSKNMRVYNEPAQHESFSDGEHVTGISTQTFTLIPEAVGELTLPALTLPWWDIKSQSMQNAELPAKTINVLQGNGVGNITMTPPTLSNTNTVNTALASTSINAAEPASLGAAGINPSMIPKEKWLGLELDVILFILAALSIILLLYLLKRRSRTKPSSDNNSGVKTTALGDVSGAKQTQDLQNLKQEFITACESNNAQAAAQTLLKWAQNAWSNSPPSSLKDVADKLLHGAEEVYALNTYLYRSKPNSPAWHGKELAAALSMGLVLNLPKETQTEQKSLPPLYPA